MSNSSFKSSGAAIQPFKIEKKKYFVGVKLEQNLFFGVTKREMGKKGRKEEGG